MMLYLCLCSVFTVVAIAAPEPYLRWESFIDNNRSQTEPEVSTSFYLSYETTFASFKTAYGKIYTTSKEEAHRFMVFRTNLMKIEFHNKLYVAGKKSYYLGVNTFADLENWEFKELYGLTKHMNTSQSGCSNHLKSTNVVLPDSVNWITEGYVTPVKNQSECGSSWAFSSTGSLEGMYVHWTGHLVPLSEQQLVDCSRSYGNNGCNGGSMVNAFRYIRATLGIESEYYYPYMGKDGSCQFNPAKVVTTVTGCVNVVPPTETSLKLHVAMGGPVSVAIDASLGSFQFYKGGVYDEPTCSTSVLTHAVLVVGYGRLDRSDYWLVKNSWGTSWGLAGYIRMSRNKENQCGIATMASYPCLKFATC